MEKQKIYEFDPQIYPRKLWVAVTKGTFSDVFDTELKELGEYDNADVNNVHHKEKDLGGLLIRFRSADEITAENTTHESTHVAIEIFDYIEARIDTNNQEPFAYLCGWVAGCIEEVKQKLTENGEH